MGNGYGRVESHLPSSHHIRFICLAKLLCSSCACVRVHVLPSCVVLATPNFADNQQQPCMGRTSYNPMAEDFVVCVRAQTWLLVTML